MRSVILSTLFGLVVATGATIGLVAQNQNGGDDKSLPVVEVYKSPT